MTTRLLFKVTGEDGTPYHGGTGRWPLPTRHADGTWTPGEPRTVHGPLRPCANGLHLCRPEDLIHWLGPVLWTVNVPEGVEAIAESDKLVVRTARLERRVETWTERSARHLACDCAARVLHLTTDPRPADAIRIARRFAEGMATGEELAAAQDAAWAAWAAAWDARAAAWAAWAAARAAAGAAARAAAGTAARAAGAAAGAAERRWQADRLMQYLRGEVDMDALTGEG